LAGERLVEGGSQLLSLNSEGEKRREGGKGREEELEDVNIGIATLKIGDHLIPVGKGKKGKESVPLLLIAKINRLSVLRQGGGKGIRKRGKRKGEKYQEGAWCKSTSRTSILDLPDGGGGPTK